MGNHEYYNSTRTVDEILAEARATCNKLGNVHLLERDAFNLTPTTRLLGCTLWSPLTEKASLRLNDLSKIHLQCAPFRRTLDLETYNAWHLRDRSWLQKELDSADGKRVVVLTHHGPLPLMSGRYKGDPSSSAYVGDLSHLFKEPAVAFASGHVHSNVDTFCNGIRSVSNAMGYPGEDTGYKEDVVIDIS